MSWPRAVLTALVLAALTGAAALLVGAALPETGALRIFVVLYTASIVLGGIIAQNARTR